MIGTTGVPGQNSAAIFVIAPMISLLSGEGGLGVGCPIWLTEICGSASTRTNAALTSSTGSPGMIRQLTVDRAAWGNALYACPPSSRVVKQVVRSWAL